MDQSSRHTKLPQFTILQMLVSLGIVSLVCASFIAPNGILAALWHVSVFVALTSAIAAAVYRTAAIRAFWIGFALFGWLFVVTEKTSIFDMKGVAIVVVHETLLRALEDVYQRQAAQAAEASIRRGNLSFPGPNVRQNISYQTPREMETIKRWLGENTFCLLVLLVALLGGVIGRCLFLTRPSPAADSADRA